MPTALYYVRAYRCDECKTYHCECRDRTPEEQRAWVLAEGWEERWEIQTDHRWLVDQYLAGADPATLASPPYYV